MSDPANEHLRFAPPRARVAEPVDSGLVLAGRGTRFGAALIDVVIALGYLWLMTLVLPWNPFLDTQGSLRLMVQTQAISFAAFLVVHGVLLARRGQTVGKWLTGVRIVRPDGQQAGALRLIGLRYGLGFVLASVPIAGPIYALIDSLMIFGSRRRCLHDLIAGTIVIRA